MPFLLFLSEIILISLSGVMSPGPMTTVTVGKGNISPHAGAWIAVGHGIVEFPLMVAIFLGIGYLFDLPYVQTAIALVGGAFLLWMGIGMLRSTRQAEIEATQDTRSPILVGILLSAGNPYFLIWWATVGATLVLRSVTFGILGFVTFALAHWLCDFVWSYLLSAMAFKGGEFFGRRFQQGIFALCGVLLIFFSGKLILDGLHGLGIS
ncbi:MAG: LysE family transporter [Anaerolineae bacterium]|nr:LysE family transporter [Anaerolineae bacterium]